MNNIGKILWLFPFAAQVGYILATYEEMPRLLGGTADDPGTRIHFFVAEWFAVVGVANIVFVFVHLKLHKFSDRMLSVPGKAYWLGSTETREVLVEKLRGICEAALLMLNIFFLAVYQSIYQSNVARPVFQLPSKLLIVAFMALPLVIILGVMVWTMRALATEARQKDPKNDSQVD